MRDMLLLYTEDEGFDIDIKDGYPVDVERESQTGDQRAAIGAVFLKGSLPANQDFGVDWTALYDNDVTVMDVANEVQSTIQRVASSEGNVNNNYYPIFVPKDNGDVGVTVMKGAVR